MKTTKIKAETELLKSQQKLQEVKDQKPQVQDDFRWLAGLLFQPDNLAERLRKALGG